MNLALLRKNVAEAKWLLLSCGLALIGIAWARVWIISQLDTSKFQQILEMLPDNWLRFYPVDVQWVITYTGRIAFTWDEPIMVLCLAVWCIARGSDCISGEIGRGTMEMLLAQPVSRLQVLTTHSLVTVAGAALLVGASWLGIYLGIQTTSIQEDVSPKIKVPWIDYEFSHPFAESKQQTVPMRDKVTADLFFPAVVNFFALGVFLAGVSALMSSWDRYRWRTIGILAGMYVVASLLKLMGVASESCSWMLWLSFFTPYEPEMFVAIAMQTPLQTWDLFRYSGQGHIVGLGPLGSDLILIMLGLICYIGAAVIFCRRDLPAPL